MNALTSLLLRIAPRSASDESGQGMAEYGLILALVAVVVIVALTALGGGIGNTLNTVTAQL
jgi:pilus assembly protein Flp/PilA